MTPQWVIAWLLGRVDFSASRWLETRRFERRLRAGEAPGTHWQRRLRDAFHRFGSAWKADSAPPMMGDGQTFAS